MGTLTVVFDTNTLISAYGFGGKPQQCLDLAFLGKIELLTSWPALNEFRRVMDYERLPFTEEDRKDLPLEIVALPNSTVIDPELEINAVEDDPDDDKFLECAIEGNADCIISGDDHLLDLHPFEEIEIVKPAIFMTKIL